MIFVELEPALAVIAEVSEELRYRDPRLLASALGRVRLLFQYDGGDIFTIGAVYIESIVRNHPLLDGNKRAAWLVANLFLKYNGYVIKGVSFDDDNVIQAIQRLIERRVSREFMSGFLFALAEQR